jgi:RNA polymerase sigma-70 factor, ECF subfamily
VLPLVGVVFARSLGLNSALALVASLPLAGLPLKTRRYQDRLDRRLPGIPDSRNKLLSHFWISRHHRVEMSGTEPVGDRGIHDFEDLVREHQAGLRAFVRALGVDEAWVDDLAQETFIVAYRRRNGFEAGTDFGKWLRSIARHLAANERRKSARRSRLLPFAVADLLLDQGHAADAVETNSGRWMPALQECVGQLPPRSRELLRRRYAASETSIAIARELRMTADSVRQTLLRIRVAVKECIERKMGGTRL